MKNNVPKRKIFGDAVDLLTDVPMNVDSAGVQMIPVDKIKDFHDHPFRLYEGERLQDMVDSIREHGILNPVIVWKRENEYEMLAGHNRKHAAIIAGLTEIPAIIKQDITEEEAYVYVIETNVLQRSFAELLPSEKAAVMATRYNKICNNLKHEQIVRELEILSGKKRNEKGGQNGHRAKSRDVIAATYGFSGRSAARYIRLNYLIPAFKELVDMNKLRLTAAVELSYLDEADQEFVRQFALKENEILKLRAVVEIRKHSGKLTEELLQELIPEKEPEKPELRAIQMPKTIYDKYFGLLSEEEQIALLERALATWTDGEEDVDV